MPELIDRMLANRRLERVAADPSRARTLLETAEQHVKTADILADTDDHAMAFTAADDAVRKALVAVLAAEGLRARPVSGAHRNTGIAAGVFVTDAALEEFDWMRQVRNATEYPDGDRPTATHQDVEEALEAAAKIVTACGAHLRGRA